MAPVKRGSAGQPMPGSGARRVRPAFTLIELLVVASVIVLLLSITVPAMSAARRLSKRTVCGTNLHSIGQGILAYLHANQETYPALARWPLDNPKSYPSLPDGLRKEVGGSREVFRCPADMIPTSKREKDEQLRGKEKYWEVAGTSYEWNEDASGVRLNRDVTILKSDDVELKWTFRTQPWAAHLVSDFDSYHGGAGKTGSMMFLYADLHVAPDKAKEGV